MTTYSLALWASATALSSMAQTPDAILERLEVVWAESISNIYGFTVETAKAPLVRMVLDIPACVPEIKMAAAKELCKMWSEAADQGAKPWSMDQDPLQSSKVGFNTSMLRPFTPLIEYMSKIRAGWEDEVIANRVPEHSTNMIPSEIQMWGPDYMYDVTGCSRPSPSDKQIVIDSKRAEAARQADILIQNIVDAHEGPVVIIATEGAARRRHKQDAIDASSYASGAAAWWILEGDQKGTSFLSAGSATGKLQWAAFRYSSPYAAETRSFGEGSEEMMRDEGVTEALGGGKALCIAVIDAWTMTTQLRPKDPRFSQRMLWKAGEVMRSLLRTWKAMMHICWMP